MKQSTKLLCLVLSLLMAFSCFSVIGSAVLTKDDIKYDNIDDADLSKEQVATLALDLVDGLLEGGDTIDLSILGELRLDSIDGLLSSLINITNGTIFGFAKGLAGDIGSLEFGALEPNGALQRSMGDYYVITQLLQFIADNADILSKVANGIDTSGGIDLGLVGNFLSLGDIEDLLADIPGFLVETVYDLLVYGSYKQGEKNDSYMSLDELEEAGTTFKTRYPEVSTLDGIVTNALYNLLTKPQEYSWVPTGEVDPVTGEDITEKVWEDAVISPTFASMDETEAKALINPMANSFFAILDNIAQIAIDDLGVIALNNNLKKELMEACEVEFNELGDANELAAGDFELPGEVAAVFADEAAYVTYIGYDCIAKADNGVWYYTTLKNEPVDADGDGEVDLDEEENEIWEKVRVYFKANFGAANEFASLINWDWQFCGSQGGEGTALIYKEIKYEDTIVGGLNNLVKLVYDQALTEETKADYVETMAAAGIDITGWEEGGNDKLGDNITNLVKYILSQYGEKVFGKGSAYSYFTLEELAPYTIVDMVALIGPEFFEDAMPQIILPKNADGTYAFTEGKQIWEFGAIVLRELITGIAPNVNYDNYIFANGDVTSANDRLPADHTVEEWFNIIVNMGIDTGYTYLNQITNFNTEIPAEGIDRARWEGMLDAAILWAVDYVGEGDLGILNGINPTSVGAIDGPINKLSFILNKILPLGFVGDAYQSTNESWGSGLDLNKIIERFKTLLTTFDLTVLTDLFGRSEVNWNLLGSTNLVNGVLKLANQILNLVFGAQILNGIAADGATQSIDTVISKANLQTTIKNLLTGLNTRKEHILASALPVVGKLIKGWGTEQEFKNPTTNLASFVTVSNGTTYSVSYDESGVEKDCDGNIQGGSSQAVINSNPIKYNISNESVGLWRHYVDADGKGHKDDQYKLELVSIDAYNIDGTKSTYVRDAGIETTGLIDYGSSGTVYFNVGSVTASGTDYSNGGVSNTVSAGDGASNVDANGAIVRLDVGYKVYGHDGTALLDGKVYYAREFVYLTTNSEVEAIGTQASSDDYASGIYSPIYVDFTGGDAIENLKSKEIGYMWRNANTSGNQDHSIVPNTATIDGMTMSSVTWTSTGKDYSTTGIRLFDTYTQQFVGAPSTASALVGGSGETTTASVTGSVDKTAFYEAISLDDVVTTGRSATWYVKLVTKNETKTDVPVTITFYDGEYRSALIDLINEEIEGFRQAGDYLQSGTVEATSALKSEDFGSDAEENFELRQTNFEVGENGVTVIDCAEAWAEYEAAFNDALIVGLQDKWNANSRFDFRAVYRRLRVAIDDVEKCRDTSAASVDGMIDDLDELIKTLNADSTDIYDFTDYKMYRLNRYNDARDDASYYINLKDDAAPADVTYIDEYFDYEWMEENDYRALVAGHEKETWLLSLLKKFSEEEIASKDTWLTNKKLEYATVKEIDVAIAEELVQMNNERLLRRDVGVINDQLVDEVSSAINMIGDANNGRYTEESWANYAEALASAQAAQASDSQKEIFGEKYNLLIARKRLVEVDNAADYNELEVLIKQAEFALAHSNLYSNEAYDFARVLAELGMDPIAHEDGYDVQLFPGSAYLVLERGYAADDQNKVDNAARELKVALARLRFKSLGEILGAQTVEETTLVEADEDKGIEAVTATVATIDENLGADDVAEMLSIEGTTVDEITVSTDVNYAAAYETYKPLEGFAGTNATVTFYQSVDGVMIPVKTVKLVVPGDINGDGTVDVLDASYASLVAANKGDLDGLYRIAGNLVVDDEINVDDYGQIVNKVIA